MHTESAFKQTWTEASIQDHASRDNQQLGGVVLFEGLTTETPRAPPLPFVKGARPPHGSNTERNIHV